MKIAFAGDSFCMNAFPDTPSWPHLVAKKLNADIIQMGHGGQHFFHAVHALMPKILLADIIVMCVSEPYRLINNYNLPMNYTWTEQMNTKTGDHWKNRQRQVDEHNMPFNKLIKIAEAANEYYNHIFDFGLAEVLQLTCVSFIDQLLKEHKKKVIWFPCFHQSFEISTRNDQDETYYEALKTRMVKMLSPIYTDNLGRSIENLYYLPMSGPSANIPLFEISHLELKMDKRFTDDGIDYQEKNDNRLNHFNDENNINMANLIINIINNDDFTPKEIKMEEYFLHMGNMRFDNEVIKVR
jgi:hypothetical protein